MKQPPRTGRFSFKILSLFSNSSRQLNKDRALSSIVIPAVFRERIECDALLAAVSITQGGSFCVRFGKPSRPVYHIFAAVGSGPKPHRVIAVHKIDIRKDIARGHREYLAPRRGIGRKRGESSRKGRRGLFIEALRNDVDILVAGIAAEIAVIPYPNKIF